MSAPRITGPIPNSVLEKMDSKDRPPGVSGMLASEIHANNVVKAEKALQKDISRLLKLKQIPFINPPMNKRSMLPIGWPDYTIILPNGITIFWEAKAVGGALRPEQVKMRDALTFLGHQWRLIRYLGEAQAHLREIGSK